MGKGVTSAIAPGHIDMFELAMSFVEGTDTVEELKEGACLELAEHYQGYDPIFHKRNASGNKVTHAQ
jgi:hypothetical protein